MLYKIVLKGCRPEPLSNYLKALGVLRVLSEARPYAQCKGYWENEQFVLITTLTEQEIREFFLADYAPSPLVSPWNGSTGFYAKDKQKGLLDSIRQGAKKRFENYQETLSTAQTIVDDLKLKEQPKDPQAKKQLLSQLRDRLPDIAAQWIDTCVMVTTDEDSPLKFVPLTGTGGNDGNFEFGRTFMQQLQNVIEFTTGNPTEESEKLLRSALFDEVLPKLPYSGKIGQFNPIAAGGANATTGTDGDSRVNPWDFILMLEGMLMFMPGITRRGESGNAGIAAPFTASSPSLAGYGSAAEENVRAELWVPLWRRPVGLEELQVLFREGRAKVKSSNGQLRTAKTGVDFVRAVTSLGIARGITAFHRYGFQERNGLSYFAVSLNRFKSPPYPQADPLQEIDAWIQQFLRLAKDDNTPENIRRSGRQLENAMIDQALGKTTLLDLLITLGEVEKALNQSLKFTLDKNIRPIPALRFSQWVGRVYEDSSEFRLALALASNRASGHSLRQRLVQVRPQGKILVWVKEDEDKITTWQSGSLEDNLLLLMQRTEIEEEQKRNQSKGQSNDRKTDEDESTDELMRPRRILPNFQDVQRWIAEDCDDDRLEAIARGLSLLKFPKSSAMTAIDAQPQALPMAYRVLKLVQHRNVKPNLELPPVELPPVRGLLGKLAADRLEEALVDAARRLRARNLRPRVDPNNVKPWLADLSSRRLGAALAFPLLDGQITYLLETTQIIDDQDRESDS
ncbi:type I-U CRISPR-associated protein Csx17 [Alkalinema pantanalense CENA528]|uniref:type I-G CRISPR-associated protein Cas8g1/Csx17 n=1 Tax=Alkalinema pantanalense TaxID=1620705 RepID=UPI003D6DB5B4